jgi:hypothetical protein
MMGQLEESNLSATARNFYLCFQEGNTYKIQRPVSCDLPLLLGLATKSCIGSHVGA